MQRYSRKRQAILDLLRSTDTHPSAEWVHTRLRARFPDLSLATVYRNLLQFRQEGLVRSVGVVDGQERFDANCLPHAHAVCTGCGRVLDVMELNPSPEYAERVRELTGFTVRTSTLQFSGLCRECAEKMLISEGKNPGDQE